MVSCSHLSSSSLGSLGEVKLCLNIGEVRYGECWREGGIGIWGGCAGSRRDLRRGILEEGGGWRVFMVVEPIAVLSARLRGL